MASKDALAYGCEVLARAEGHASFELMKELQAVLAEEIDENMALPLCKEIQGKIQKISSRVEELVERREQLADEAMEVGF